MRPWSVVPHNQLHYYSTTVQSVDVNMNMNESTMRRSDQIVITADKWPITLSAANLLRNNLHCTAVYSLYARLLQSSDWMAAYLGYTLWMKTLLRGWPVMAHETHTTRRYREIFNEQTSDTKTQNAASLTATATQSSTAQTVNQHSAWNHRIVRVFWQWPEVFTEYLTISVFHIQLAHAFDSEAHI